MYQLVIVDDEDKIVEAWPAVPLYSWRERLCRHRFAA